MIILGAPPQALGDSGLGLEKVFGNIEEEEEEEDGYSRKGVKP